MPRPASITSRYACELYQFQSSRSACCLVRGRPRKSLNLPIVPASTPSSSSSSSADSSSPRAARPACSAASSSRSNWDRVTRDTTLMRTRREPASTEFFMSSYNATPSELISSAPNSSSVRAMILNAIAQSLPDPPGAPCEVPAHEHRLRHVAAPGQRQLRLGGVRACKSGRRRRPRQPRPALFVQTPGQGSDPRPARPVGPRGERAPA